MSLDHLTPGPNPPRDLHVVIEIPAGSAPVKYEFDKGSGFLMVDRFLSTSMVYPANYGFIPKTLAEDGDPVDALVVTPVPLYPATVIRARPIGLLRMTDEHGPDAKLMAVPVDEVSREYAGVHKIQDFPASLLDRVAHFFAHYKDHESGKWARVEGWEGVEAAHAEVQGGIARYGHS